MYRKENAEKVLAEFLAFTTKGKASLMRASKKLFEEFIPLLESIGFEVSELGPEMVSLTPPADMEGKSIALWYREDRDQKAPFVIYPMPLVFGKFPSGEEYIRHGHSIYLNFNWLEGIWEGPNYDETYTNVPGTSKRKESALAVLASEVKRKVFGRPTTTIN